MAEPDLAPLVLVGDDASLTSVDNSIMLTESSVDVDLLRRDLPELPMQTRLRLNAQYGTVSIHVECTSVCPYMIAYIVKLMTQMSIFCVQYLSAYRILKYVFHINRIMKIWFCNLTVFYWFP